MAWNWRTACGLLLRSPLILVSSLCASVFLIWKRSVRAKRVESATKRGGPGVLVLGGRKVVYSDLLMFVLDHWAPPAPEERSVFVSIDVPEGGGAICVRPAHGDGKDVALSTAHYINEGRLRRELLFEVSLGFHFAGIALRACGAVFPPMRVAAVVLPYLPDRKSLLLTRRAPIGGSYNSMWVFPGGVVDAGEAISAAAVREVAEETGLHVRPESVRQICAYQARNETTCLTYLMLIFSGEIEGGDLALQRKEVSQAAFLTRAAIDELLSGGTEGQVEGVTHGPTEGALVDCAVPLSELVLAKDGAVTIGPGIGAGHWFALQEWQRAAL